MCSCDDAELLLSIQLDDKLTKEEEESLQAHLARCPTCAELALDLVRIQKNLPPQVAVPPEVHARVMDAVAREGKQAKKLAWWKPLASVAAVAALVVAGMYGMGNGLPGAPASAPEEGAVALEASLEPAAAPMAAEPAMGSQEAVESRITDDVVMASGVPMTPMAMDADSAEITYAVAEEESIEEPEDDALSQDAVVNSMAYLESMLLAEGEMHLVDVQALTQETLMDLEPIDGTEGLAQVGDTVVQLESGSERFYVVCDGETAQVLGMLQLPQEAPETNE